MEIFQAKKLLKALKPALLLLLALITFAYTIPWVLSQSMSAKTYSGIDMHAYWYPGLYFRQGVNPYAAILNNPHPNYWDPRRPGSGDPMALPEGEYSLRLPISFLGGEDVTSFPVTRLMIEIPSATAPLGILLWTFSWIAWPVVRIAWAVINILLAIMAPWFVMRLSGKEDSLGNLDQWILAFLFYNIYGLRQGIVVGQQTLLCLVLILISLRLHKHWLFAGVLLGIALSKYSVAIPFFIFLLIYQKYRILLTSVAVQVIGLLLLMPMKWGTPLETIKAYLKVLEVHSGQSGIQIASILPAGGISIILMGLIAIFVILLLFVRGNSGKLIDIFAAEHLNKLNILILVTLLTTYHRIYDTSLTIFFFFFLMVSLMKAGNSASRNWRVSMAGVGIISGALIMYPTFFGKIAGLAGAPQALIAWLSPEAVTTVALLIMFAFSSLFSPRLSQEWTRSPIPGTNY